MIRTQIHLSEEDIALLDRVVEESGASRAELIRRAVRAMYGSRDRALRGRTPDERVANMRAAFGLWKDRPFTTEQYLHAIRHGEPLPDD